MKRQACRYAIVRFMPYPETGEFANVGVVLICPQTGYFGYKLQTRKYARYTNFFRELEPAVYLRSIAAFKNELDRVSNLAQQTIKEPKLREIFDFLLHPRDAVIGFCKQRAILVESPKEALEELYCHYVQHDFVTPEYKEGALAKRVQEVIQRLDLQNPFKNDKLGSEDFSVRFPLVQRVDGVVTKLIKPFYLAQNDPNRIYEHADSWFMKLRRLQARGQLPQKVLFTVEGPSDGERLDVRGRAFREVCENLEEFALVAPEHDKKKIVEFASQTTH